MYGESFEREGRERVEKREGRRGKKKEREMNDKKENLLTCALGKGGRRKRHSKQMSCMCIPSYTWKHKAYVLTTKCNLYTVFYTYSLSTTEWIPLGGSYHLTALLTSRDLTVPSVEVHTYIPILYNAESLWLLIHQWPCMISNVTRIMPYSSSFGKWVWKSLLAAFESTNII